MKWHASAPARLSPAGAGGSTVGLDSCGLGLTVAGSRSSAAISSLAVDGIRQRGLAHAADGLAATRALAVLPVGGEVEGDEEEEVRGQDTNTSESGKLLTSAGANVGKPGPVGRGEVGPGGEVDKA